MTVFIYGSLAFAKSHFRSSMTNNVECKYGTTDLLYFGSSTWSFWRETFIQDEN
jgi:hypothetical protein